MVKNLKLVAAVIAVIIVVAAIGVVLYSNNSKNGGNSDTMLILDDRGLNVTVPKHPQRIVTLGSCFTEILFAINASVQVVGVDNLSNYPAGVASKTDVGSETDPNIQDVLGLSPDLVIAWTHATIAISTLEANDVPVLAYEPKTIGDVMYLIQRLGKVTSRTDNAENVVLGMEEVVENVLNKVGELDDAAKPSVYVELMRGDGDSPGTGTIIDDIITLASGLNINTFDGYTSLDGDFVIAADPDFIILETQNDHLNSDIGNRTGWESITAVQDDNIMRIDQGLLTPGPRVIYALVQFATWFHPSLFE